MASFKMDMSANPGDTEQTAVETVTPRGPQRQQSKTKRTPWETATNRLLYVWKDGSLRKKLSRDENGPKSKISCTEGYSVSQLWKARPHGPGVPLSDFKLNDVDGAGRTSTSNTNHTLAPNNQTMHVSGKVGNIVYTWLVDTGADVACISAQLPGIDKLAIQTTRSSPVAANG
jgi:hypothetical protein